MRLHSTGATALVLGALTGLAGATSPQEDPQLAAVRETQARLENLHGALRMFYLERERPPTMKEGLAVLLGPSRWGPVYLEGGEEQLNDAWGVPFQNREEDAFLQDLRSFGPDGIGGNDDDLWLAPGGVVKGGVPTLVPELEQPAEEPVPESVPATEEPAPDNAEEPPPPSARLLQRAGGQLAPGDLIAEVALQGNGDVAWVAKRGERMVLCTGAFESDPMHRIYSGIYTGSVPGAVAVKGSHGSQRFVVTPQGRQPYKELVSEPQFLEGSTVLAFRDRVADDLRWTIGGVHEPLVDAPVLDSDGRFVAYRERRDDGWYMITAAGEHGPHKWVSQPLVLSLADGDVLFHRRWDGNETSVVVGDQVYKVTWARDPVVSPDGSSVALAVNMGGVPAADFEALRERSWSADSGLPRAFDGGKYHPVKDWRLLDAYDHVGDPIFSPTSDTWSHLARDESGQWFPVLRSASRVVSGPPGAAVTGLSFDLTGEMVNFQATDPGALKGQHVVSLHRDADACEDSAAGAILKSLPGQRAFCGVLRDEDCYLFHEGMGEPAVRSGPYENARLIGKLISDHPVARVRRDGQNFLFAECEYGPFDEMSEVAFGPWDVLGVSMKVGDEYEVRHINTPGKEDGWSRYGGLAWAGTPVFLPSGSMRTPVRLTANPDSYHWLHWSMSEYELEGPFEGLTEVTLRADGEQYAWASQRNGLWSVHLWGTRVNSVGPPFESIHGIHFGHDGRLVYWGESEEGAVMVDDDVPGKTYDRIAAVDHVEGRNTLAYRVEVGDKQAWVVGGIQGPLLDTVSTELLWSEDGEVATYVGFDAGTPRALEGSSGTWKLLVTDTGTGSTYGSGHDSVSRPTFSEDQASVQFASQEGDQIHFMEWRLARKEPELR